MHSFINELVISLDIAERKKERLCSAYFFEKVFEKHWKTRVINLLRSSNCQTIRGVKIKKDTLLPGLWRNGQKISMSIWNGVFSWKLHVWVDQRNPPRTDGWCSKGYEKSFNHQWFGSIHHEPLTKNPALITDACLRWWKYASFTRYLPLSHPIF